MRLESQRGAYVSVVRKGAQQAGAVFVIHRLVDQTFDVYGPAPQSLIEEEVSDRFFEQVLSGVNQARADEYLDRQLRFDPDLWIIETESGSGQIALNLAKAI